MADLLAPLPIIDLLPGATIQFEAIDPTTGADVAGVRVTACTAYGDAIDGHGDIAQLEPVWLQTEGT